MFRLLEKRRKGMEFIRSSEFGTAWLDWNNRTVLNPAPREKFFDSKELRDARLVYQRRVNDSPEGETT